MKFGRVLAFTFNLAAMCGFVWLLCHASLVTYLLKQGRGQLNILLHTRPVAEVLADTAVSFEQKQKLLLVQEVKRYSVDSLGYKDTRNFTTYFDQQDQPVLWVVTACKPFAFEPYTWTFPVVGEVSYKGFFNRSLAQREYIGLMRRGYDADLSTVSAWSTLGWLPDPVLSSMLNRSRGRLAALLFHELFHATYYAPGTVDVNENLANFFSYKATLRFLAGDTAELNSFRAGMRDDSLYNAFVFEAYGELNRFYHDTEGLDSLKRMRLREARLAQIYLRASRLPLSKPGRFTYANRAILGSKNAFFIDAQRYDGLYDSLNNVLLTRFKGDLRAMILGLKK
jgi:predicted aminopeptidase